MTIPRYDTTTLPCISSAMENQQEETRYFMGGLAIVGEMTATINTFAINNLQMEALYDFWKNDCNFGTTPFLITLPFFGRDTDYLVQFNAGLNAKKDSKVWTSAISLKVLGEASYELLTNSNTGVTYGS